MSESLNREPFKKRPEAIAGDYSPLAMAQKFEGLPDADKDGIDRVLNQKGLPPFDSFLQPDITELLSAESRQELSSLLGTLILHREEKEKLPELYSSIADALKRGYQ